MTKKEIINSLEKERNSRIVSYITGDRQPFATRIADDIIPLLNNLLERIGRTKK